MNDYRNIDDMSLAQLLFNGDEQAFAEIYDRYSVRLFVYAMQMLGNTEESKDLVQDVFINLWKIRTGTIFETSIASYLYKSVRNRSLNIFARREVEQKHLDSLNQLLAVNAQNSDYLIREKEMEIFIERQINSLPPKMQQVFVLSRKSHKSHKEIAEELEISEETVNTQITRALKILRKKLGPLFVFIPLL